MKENCSEVFFILLATVLYCHRYADDITINTNKLKNTTIKLTMVLNARQIKKYEIVKEEIWCLEFPRSGDLASLDYVLLDFLFTLY